MSQLRSYTWGNLAVLTEAVVLLSAVRAGLLLFRLRQVNGWLGRVSVPRRAQNQRPAETILWAVGAAEKYSPMGSTCLVTALAGQALLRRHGHDSKLQIGVRRDESGKFHAHAWLEREGRIVIGGPLAVVQNYTAMPGVEHLIA